MPYTSAHLLRHRDQWPMRANDIVCAILNSATPHRWSPYEVAAHDRVPGAVITLWTGQPHFERKSIGLGVTIAPEQ